MPQRGRESLGIGAHGGGVVMVLSSLGAVVQEIEPRASCHLSSALSSVLREAPSSCSQTPKTKGGVSHARKSQHSAVIH